MTKSRFALRRTIAYLAAIALILPAMGAARAAEPREVRVAIGLSMQPYIIRNKSAGIEYDIIREALESEGYRMVPVYRPFIRVAASFSHGEVDAAATMSEDAQIKAYFSDTHIVYRNYAMSLAHNHFKIDRIEDLADHSIEAFQHATIFIGPRFAAVAARSKRYTEHADQAEQNRLLHAGRTDVVVADINIFKFHETELADLDTLGIDTHAKVAYHDIFPPTPYKVAFASETVRDAFNRGLAKLHKSGEYERIYERYVPRDAASGAGQR